MAIDQVGSCVNLSKQMLMDLDRNAEMTSVRTATLEMLLQMLIRLGQPDVPRMQMERMKTVAETIARTNG